MRPTRRIAWLAIRDSPDGPVPQESPSPSPSLIVAGPRWPRPHAAGEVVPRDVREMYDRGLQYLATTQTERGDWPAAASQGPGVTGMAFLALLASGEDPNFGLYYSNHIRKALRVIINAQDAATGFLRR